MGRGAIKGPYWRWYGPPVAGLVLASVAYASDGPKHGAWDRAEACLDDPQCPADQASRLFRAADDAHEKNVDCLRFLDGDGTTQDLARARACLQRSAPPCDGPQAQYAWARMWRIELVIVLIDGIGGPVDVAGARSAVGRCDDDYIKEQLLQHADERSRNPGTAPVHFCADYVSSGPAADVNECAAREQQHERTRAALEAKRVVAPLDAAGRRAFAAAATAYRRYVDAVATWVLGSVDGNMSVQFEIDTRTGLLARRADQLAHLAQFDPHALTATVESWDRDVGRAFASAKARADTPERLANLVATQRAWLAYRDAEVAFYKVAFASRAAAPEIERAVRATTSDMRVHDLD